MSKQLLRYMTFPVAATLVFAASAFAQSQNQLSITSITPSEGQIIYGNKIPVLIAYENFTIVEKVPNPSPVSNQGYIHLWLDEENPTTQNATKLYEEIFTYSDVPYGNHTLKAELVNALGNSLAPPQNISVNFKTAEPVSPIPAQKVGIDKNTALVIFIIVALVIIAAWWYTKEDSEELEIDAKAPVKKKTLNRKISKKSKTSKRT